MSDGPDEAGADSPRRSLSRRDARTRALELLFAADVRGLPLDGLLDAPDAGWVDDFTRRLVEAVALHRTELDAVIGERARGWTMDRMPAVDRNLLRLGLAEMLHIDDVPPLVAIDEAVELAKELSTDDSPRFVNGILAAVHRERVPEEG